MKIQNIFAAATLAIAGSAAFAGTAIHTGEVTQFVDAPSTLTRAEVVAELQRARTDGSLAQPTTVAQTQQAPKVASGLTRAEVLAELQRARADGSLNQPTTIAQTQQPHSSNSVQAAE